MLCVVDFVIMAVLLSAEVLQNQSVTTMHDTTKICTVETTASVWLIAAHSHLQGDLLSRKCDTFTEI